MGRRFEELDWRETPMGALSLRRRREPVTGDDVYEVKLGEEFLMSSMFTAGEVALAERGLAELTGAGLDVVVGGLGLGYTAEAVLDDPRVRSLLVVEALGEVVEWHREGLVPLGRRIASDPRCRLVHGDFFALAGGGGGFDPEAPERRFDAVLLDIDHSPDHVLSPGHQDFYRPAGLRALARSLRSGGVFALWSDDPPSERFGSVLREVFPGAGAHVVSFENPLLGSTAANTVYAGRKP